MFESISGSFLFILDENFYPHRSQVSLLQLNVHSHGAGLAGCFFIAAIYLQGPKVFVAILNSQMVPSGCLTPVLSFFHAIREHISSLNGIQILLLYILV